jgi:hypothetical protein
MTLPGFNAEYGLFKSANHYRSHSSEGHVQALGEISSASQVVPAACQTGCIETPFGCSCPIQIQPPHCVEIDGIRHCYFPTPKCPVGFGGVWPNCVRLDPCRPGLAYCPQSDPLCVNLQTDSNNCGTCGHQCKNGQSCRNGTCVCPDGQASLNTNNDCGSCGTICANGQSCRNGTCVCPDGQTSLNTNNDCGSCGTICANGQSCRNGTCVCPDGHTSLNTNDDCGSCGTICSGDLSCQNGTCACPAGSQQCGMSDSCCAPGTCQCCSRDASTPSCPNGGFCNADDGQTCTMVGCLQNLGTKWCCIDAFNSYSAMQC